MMDKIIDTIESTGYRVLKTKKSIYIACAVAITSALFFIMVVYIFVPLGCDGGWFSYPALSLSRGGDPGENQMNVLD